MDTSSSDLGERSSDDCTEFFVVDQSVAILVGIVNHLVDLSRREALTNCVTDSLEIFRAEGLGSIAEHVEHLLEGLFAGFFLLAEDGKESTEVKFFGVGISLHNANNVGCLALHIQGTDGVNDFFHGNLSAVVIVEQIEHLLELGDSLDGHVLVDVFVCIKALR